MGDEQDRDVEVCGLRSGDGGGEGSGEAQPRAAWVNLSLSGGKPCRTAAVVKPEAASVTRRLVEARVLGSSKLQTHGSKVGPRLALLAGPHATHPWLVQGPC